MTKRIEWGEGRIKEFSTHFLLLAYGLPNRFDPYCFLHSCFFC